MPLITSPPTLSPQLTLPNHQTLATLRNLTASLFGVGAGILGLESYAGFLFYLFFSLLTSTLVYVFRVQPALAHYRATGASRSRSSSSSSGDGAMGIGGLKLFFRRSTELWTGGLLDGLSGFILTWTLFYGLLRA
jgi:hypothetical protein